MRRRHPRGRSVALVAVLALGCTRPLPNDPIHLETDAPGLSGLAMGPDGSLWAIPEERRELLRIDRETGAVTAYPIEGMPEGVEAEALSHRGNGEFVVGTETEGEHDHDHLFVLDFDGRVARVRETYECPYELWGLQSGPNRGLEGLCTVGEDGIVVAAEVTGSVRGRRFAPLAWRRPNGEWSAYRVWLSSQTGKLAGVTCRRTSNGGAEVLAVERHFGVTRILGFDLPPPAGGEPVSVEPRVVVDLDDWVRSLDQQPNFEGIVRLDDDRVALLVDNQYRGLRTGPSELWIVTLNE